MKNLFIRLVLVVLLIINPMILLAEPNGPPAEGDPPTPIDQGIYILLAIAFFIIVYFWKKLKLKEVI